VRLHVVPLKLSDETQQFLCFDDNEYKSHYNMLDKGLVKLSRSEQLN